MKNFSFKIFLLSSFILNSFCTCAQESVIDSLQTVLQNEKEDTSKVNTLNATSWAFRVMADYNSELKYANDALSLAEKLNYKKGTAIAHYNIGEYCMLQSNFDRALRYAFSALNIMQETGDKIGLPKIYLLISDSYFHEGAFSDAISYQYKALKVSEEINDKEDMAMSFQSLGAIYSEQGNNTDALANYQLCLKLDLETGDKKEVARTFIAIGNLYTGTGKYAEANKKISAALEIYKEIGSEAPKWGLPFCYNAYGDNFEKMGENEDKLGKKQDALKNYSMALENYLKSYEGWEKMGRKDGTSEEAVDIANIYIKMGKLSEAGNYLQNSLQFFLKIKDKSNIRNCYLGLSTLDSIHGNYKQAYEHYKLYTVYRDSIANEESFRKSLQSKMQFDFDKRETLAKAEQDKKDADAKRSKNQQYFIIASLAILVFTAIIITLIQFRNNKQKQKANIILEKQKQKVETTLSELKSTQTQLIQSEKMASLGELTAGIAHEIQNPLNFVNNFSEVNKELLEEMNEEIEKGNFNEAKAIAKDITDNEEKINHHGKRADAIVKGMLQHSRTTNATKEPTDINKLADEYLRLAYHGLRAKDKSFNATLKTDFDESIGNINIIPQDIGRVILNLITNAFYVVNEKTLSAVATPTAVKYEPTVSISTKKLNNKIEISVADNGNGIPSTIKDKIFQPFFTTKPTGQGTGLGLSLSYDIVKAHGGEIKVATKEGEGTEFIIQLPAKPHFA